jgi:hypothetical protein
VKRLGLRFVPHAVEQVDAADEWWRENRDKAPDLLVAEFIEAIEVLRENPSLGAEYQNDELEDAKRYLLRRTRFHVYYVVRDEVLVVAAIWSAIRGHGPPLGGGKP